MIHRLLQRLGAVKPAETREAKHRDRHGHREDLGRLDDPDALLTCLDDPQLASAARRRLGELFDAGLDPLALIEVDDGLARRRQLLDAVTRKGHWQPLLASLAGDDLLADVACRHPLAPVRLAAARRLMDETFLRQVEKVCRDRDKAVARLMRERLDALRQARTRVRDIDARLTDLAADLDHLARIEDEPHLEERLQWLERQQQALCQERSTFAAAFEQCGQQLPDEVDAVAAFAATAYALRGRLAEADAQAEARAQTLAAKDAAAADQAAVVAAVERLLQQIVDRLDADPDAGDERSQWRAAAVLEQGRWEAVCGRFEPAPELARRHTAAAGTLGRILDALERLDTLPAPPVVPADAGNEAIETAHAQCQAALERIGWPDACAPPAAVRALERARDDLDARSTAIRKQRQQAAAQIRRDVARLDRAIEQGRVRQARGIRAGIERLLETAALAADDRLRQRTESALARLDELADWQRFATTPKRRELCDAMEALAADGDLPPEPRAARVKHLREQWNELGPARDADGRALAERFDAAAERAFAPARSFFAAAAERQRFNADNRRRICDELATFVEGYAWETADWRAVERIYQHARREWRRYADVDPRDRGIGKRYHALIRTLRERLDARWQANIATKEALVRAAEALLSAPTADSAAEVRRLQREWKQVDITPRSVDQKLWAAFRAACDGIFAHLNAQTHAAQAAFDAGAEALTADVDALAERCAEQLRQPLRERQTPTDAELRTLEDRLRDLGATAPGPERGRLGRLERTLRRLRGELDDLAAEERRRQALLAAERALAASGDGSGDASTEARAAVVDLELALGLDSPEADAALRLQRQAKRLESGLRGAGSTDPVADALATLTRSGAGGALRERARQAIATALERTP